MDSKEQIGDLTNIKVLKKSLKIKLIHTGQRFLTESGDIKKGSKTLTTNKNVNKLRRVK